MAQSIPRQDYPRPQFVRNEWLNLNGMWEFEIDNSKSGRERGLSQAPHLSGKILVPFCPESSLSGVKNTDFMDAVWYKRRFLVPGKWGADKRRIFLHIGACDYMTEVWVNGKPAGRHEGGYSPISLEITDLVMQGEENVVTICASDDLRSQNQPSGKQSYGYLSGGCMYTRTTGIWQTVWLESVPFTYIAGVQCTPCLERQSVVVEADCREADGEVLTVLAGFAGKPVGRATCRVAGKAVRLELPLKELHLWEPGSPKLYDLTLTLGDDEVKSYFGMREITWVDGKMFLNRKPVFQRLVLDQGYYPDGIYTAPSDKDLKADIERSMAMGFNGARLHQKVFEPRFLYYCDILGYLVWGEYPNWGLDISRADAWQGYLPEWLEILKRDYSHPSIIGWCPLNETQDNQNPQFVKMLVDMTHAFDRTRPVIDASGWKHVQGLTDIMDVHDYEQDSRVFRKRYDRLKKGSPVPIRLLGEGYPSFVSEFGGIWWSETDNSGWGYGSHPASREEAVERFRGLVDALLDNPQICAFCYTQLTDVEQEQNGLYTYKRIPKYDPAVISAIVSRKAAFEQNIPG